MPIEKTAEIALRCFFVPYFKNKADECGISECDAPDFGRFAALQGKENAVRTNRSAGDRKFGREMVA